jgi:hypothetical protein
MVSHLVGMEMVNTFDLNERPQDDEDADENN